MRKKIKVAFPQGIKKVHVPFSAHAETYDALHYQISRIEYPKTARRVEATITCSVDLRDGLGDYEIAQVTVFK